MRVADSYTFRHIRHTEILIYFHPCLMDTVNNC
jgi:hypothetical protein